MHEHDSCWCWCRRRTTKVLNKQYLCKLSTCSYMLFISYHSVISLLQKDKRPDIRMKYWFIELHFTLVISKTLTVQDLKKTTCVRVSIKDSRLQKIAKMRNKIVFLFVFLSVAGSLAQFRKGNCNQIWNSMNRRKVQSCTFKLTEIIVISWVSVRFWACDNSKLKLSAKKYHLWVWAVSTKTKIFKWFNIEYLTFHVQSILCVRSLGSLI